MAGIFMKFYFTSPINDISYLTDKKVADWGKNVKLHENTYHHNSEHFLVVELANIKGGRTLNVAAARPPHFITFYVLSVQRKSVAGCATLLP
jgi:hypothetical protein